MSFGILHWQAVESNNQSISYQCSISITMNTSENQRLSNAFRGYRLGIFQPTITCSKLIIETIELGVKYVQS